MIDPGYRGEVQVPLINVGTDSDQVGAGDRIGQLMIGRRYANIRWVLSDSLPDSRSASGGSGATGC